MWRVYIRNNPYLGRWYTRVERRPGWVVKAALVAAAVAIVVPVVVLVLTGVVVGLVVFVVLGLVASILGAVRSVWDRLSGGGDGRQNVRVVERD